MRLLFSFLLLGAAVFALPSPQPDLVSRFPIISINYQILSQLPNSTFPLKAGSGALCYFSLFSRRVTREDCGTLILYLHSRYDFQTPRPWAVSAYEAVWELQGCRLSVTSGKWDDVFSLQDVVFAMESVLETRQPPMYLGVGGTAPVNGRPGFMYAAFHAQVTAVGGQRR